MKLTRFGILLVGLSAIGQAGPVTIAFNTFVAGIGAGSINAVEGQHQTVGFTFAGDKFVGSVDAGINNTQLYSTDLLGGSVQLFGSPLPATFSGEIAVAGSLGQSGFGAGAVYAGAGGTIYKFADNGGTPAIFASGLSGNVSGLRFDPGSSFGGNLLAVTDTGKIYRIDTSGHATVLTTTGLDTEGMDFIQSGPLAGKLVTVSGEAMRVIDANGTIHVATLIGGAGISSFETVNYVPLDIGLSGDPLEGYYAANSPRSIQKASAGQFLSQNLGGHLLATTGDGADSQVWDIAYSGVGYVFTAHRYIGTLPNQVEDGMFVSSPHFAETSAPEPGSLPLIAVGIFGIWVGRRRSQRD